jgi:hypothetical protein
LFFFLLAVVQNAVGQWSSKDKLTIERIGGSMNGDTTYLIHHRQTSTPHTNFNSNTPSVIGAFGGRTRREEAASLKENNFATQLTFLNVAIQFFPINSLLVSLYVGCRSTVVDDGRRWSTVVASATATKALLSWSI